jgi:hypothetical protein
MIDPVNDIAPLNDSMSLTSSWLSGGLGTSLLRLGSRLSGLWRGRHKTENMLLAMVTRECTCCWLAFAGKDPKSDNNHVI